MRKMRKNRSRWFEKVMNRDDSEAVRIVICIYECRKLEG